MWGQIRTEVVKTGSTTPTLARFTKVLNFGFRGISWDFVGFRGISWGIFRVKFFVGGGAVQVLFGPKFSWRFRGISWDFVGFRGILWDFVGGVSGET